MSTMNVNSKLIVAEIHSVDDIKSVLIGLGEADADFSGANGPEYLWSVAKKKKFATNAEYLADKATASKAIKVVKAGVKGYADYFAYMWAQADGYYDSIKIDVVKLNGYAEDADINGIYAFNLLLTDHH